MRNWIYTLLLLIAMLPSTGCSLFRLGWVNENSYEVQEQEETESNKDDGSILPDGMGPLGGHFNDDGEWVPDDPDIELTYKIPDISAGFIFDVRTLELSPSISVELLEFDTTIPYIRRLKVDAGVAYQRGFIYVGKLWTSVFEISTGAFGGWNWKDNEPTYGVAFVIIKF